MLLSILYTIFVVSITTTALLFQISLQYINATTVFFLKLSKNENEIIVITN